MQCSLVLAVLKDVGISEKSLYNNVKTKIRL